MRENLNQVSQWADSLGRLAERGLNQGLYKKLAEMGPQGYKYVHAFMEMTDDELAQAGSMYEEALTLPTAAANRISAGFLQTGIMATQGFAAGARRDLQEVAEAMTEVGDSAENSLRERLETHSPSEVMAAIGEDTDGGLALGILRGVDQVVIAIEVIANRIITEFDRALGSERFTALGQKVITNITSGMLLSTATMDEIIGAVITEALRAIDAKGKEINQNGKNICQQLVKGFRDEMPLQLQNIEYAIDEMVNHIYEYFTNKDHEQKFLKMLEFMVKAVCKGIMDKKTTLKMFEETFTELFAWMFDEQLQTDDMFDRFKELGMYYMEGLAEGVLEGKEAAVNAAQEVAEEIIAIMQSAKGLDEHSPSKKARRIGKWFSEGLALGIKDGSKDAYSAANALADGVVKITEIAEPKIRSAFDKIFGNIEEISTKKVAKTLAKMTGEVQVWNLTETFAQAFVPVNKLVGEVAENATKSVSKIKFNLYDANKTVEQQIKKAIKWVNKFDDNLMNLDSAEKVIKPLQKINKFFSDFNQAPKKVIRFLDKLKADMGPINNLVKEMTSSFYHQATAFKNHTQASNAARIGLLRFGSTIMDQTEAGKEYIEALEKMAEAEEKLNEARENGADGNEIAELEEQYAEAQANVTSYTNAVSKSVNEYKKQLKQALIASVDMFQHFNFGEQINPTQYVGNMLSHYKGISEWSGGIAKLATSGLNPEIIKQLADENVDSYEKVMALAAANPRTVAILNDLYTQRKKEAKKAAKEVVAALGYAYGDDAEQLRKQLQAMLNEGDKAFMELYKGNLDHYHNFLREYGAGSEQYTAFIENMQTVTTGLADVIDIAGERLLGFSDASKSTASETMFLYDGLINLGDALGVDAEEAQRTGTYIEDLTQAFTDWLKVVEDGLQIKNPFESFQEDLSYTTDQLKYNMDSQLNAVKQFADNIHTMQQMGYSPEVIKYIASLGYENGLKYTEGFVEAEQNEVGYFNEAYKEMLTIPDELAKEIGADLLAAGTEFGQALIDGANKAFEDQGVFIPLTDPSKVEEAKEEFNTVGEECADSFEEGYTEKSEYMLVDGIQNQIEDRLPEIKTVYAQAGEEAGTEGANAAVKATADTISSNNAQEQITQAYKKVTVEALRSSTDEAAQNIQEILSGKFSDLGKSVIEPFGDEIIKVLGKGFEEAASKAQDVFISAINKIIEKVKQIPEKINIQVVVDMSQIDETINKLKEIPERIDIKVDVDYSDVDDAISKLNEASNYADDLIYAMNRAKQAADSAAQAAAKAAAAAKSSSSSTKSTTSTTSTTSLLSTSAVRSSAASSDSGGTTVNLTINNPTQQSLLQTRRNASALATEVAQQLS